MTKAILVIDFDDEWLDRINTTFDEMFADVVIYKKESLENQCDYSQRIYRCWCPLKPMPEKKDVDEYQTNFSRGWDEGYNYCINEILGEEE